MKRAMLLCNTNLLRVFEFLFCIIFYDQNGSVLTNADAGTLVLGSQDNVGRDVMVYHYIPNDKYPTHSVLGINYLDFSSGWPVVV
ncbi:glycoside hydrolase family 43 protein [Cylindrobasidium torrendii FP15055 ss-10]|uniref:Glycoside hydrolase family 43 protein n=1 Tax=Cylindrobasidium torrendii FP15055 ss-10 TaxID=1314674 RepID=A0A0D7B273_9AGAR|nr:glycoside hydrolase family 43 protein [Cylindrobasidium torrendii FP15055 ss-10]